MALPANMSEWEHLQSTLLKVHNRIVREEFSDITDDDVDLAVPRSSLRWACLLKDKDTAPMTLARMYLFHFQLRGARDLQAPVYGIPLADLQASRKFKPQITLYFKQDLNDVDGDDRPVEGEVSFRLMNEDSNTITRAELITIGQKIKTVFGAANGYIWKKGRKLYSYTEKEKGYQLQLLSRSESEAKELIGKVLDIRSHTPDWKNLGKNENGDENEAYPYTPGNQTILGRTYRKPRRRPMVDIRFCRATVDLWGLTRPITLYDRSGVSIDALVE
jgi:hypothetical protein